MMKGTTRREWGKAESWIFTPLYIFLFISLLVVFHGFLLIAGMRGRRAQKRVLDMMNVCIIWNIRIFAGAKFSYIGKPTLPEGRSVIIVSNHQSMYDIPMIMWACRSREVGFIAKKELGKWIPSISLALRNLGSVLIDRKDAKASIRAIEEFGALKEEQKQVAAIFPEGTRARGGVMRNFRPSGMTTLIRAMPSALIQPVAIRGNWRILRYNFLPVPFGTTIEIEFLPPIEPGDFPAETLLGEIENRIRVGVGDDSEQLDVPPLTAAP
jgi:1-acyl-sn-glycerol-3-phosphate acyltransferase